MIVGEDPLARSGLSSLLSTEASLEIVGQTASPEEILLPSAAPNPDVLLWDLGQDARSSLERLRAFGDQGVPTVVLCPDESSAVDAYRAHLADAAGDAFRELRLAIDCANGSASVIAPDLFRDLGAEVTVVCAEPDGSNINDGCGSTHPERLARTVRQNRLDLGFAFDGDADRLIAVDERGEIVDGDVVMGVCALERLAAGTLARGLLVVSVMSNGGLERAISEAGGSVIRTPVGDRHVFEAMERSGAMLGGEQSGHVIFRDRATTGDGLLTAIELTKTLRAADGATLSQLAGRIPRLPQVMINSAVRHKDQWQIDPEFGAAVSQATNVLRGRGRILVRPSGTEPKLRIMVEGDDSEEISEIARGLARLAESRLN